MCDQKDRQAFGLFSHFGEGRGPRQKDHQIGMLHSADPDLLAIDDIAVALLDRRGLELRRVCARGWFGNAHGLQTQLTAGDLGQVDLALFFRAMMDQRIHVVHLTVTGTGISASPVDLLHDHRSFHEAKTGAAIVFRDEGRHPARFRQGRDKLFGIGAFLIDPAMIRVGKSFAERTDGIANILIGIASVVKHGVSSGNR